MISLDKGILDLGLSREWQYLQTNHDVEENLILLDKTQNGEISNCGCIPTNDLNICNAFD